MPGRDEDHILDLITDTKVPGNEGGNAAAQAPSPASAGRRLLQSPRTPGPLDPMITVHNKNQLEVIHQERANRLVPGFQPYDHPSQKVFDIQQINQLCSIASSGCWRTAKQAFRTYWGCGMG